MQISKAKKKEGRYCCAYSCKNLPVSKLGGLCHKHYRRKRRDIDPVYCRYNGFKGNAKKRGIPFFVTLEEFRGFCQRNNYIIKKGNRGRNMTIDRRCNAHGYHIWNMQILTCFQNSRKGNRFNGPDFSKPKDYDDECPF